MIDQPQPSGGVFLHAPFFLYLKMTTLPQRIKILSDDTELELIETIKNKKTTEPIGKYEYVKAKVFKGMQVDLPLSQLVYLQDCRLLKIIENKNK